MNTPDTPKHCEPAAAQKPARTFLPWPLPALLAWTAAWAGFLGLQILRTPIWLNLALCSGLGLVFALRAGSRWRRFIVAAGFPLSLAVSSLSAGMPPWVWLIPLGSLALLYPVNAWRDAPLFPTPLGALEGLPRIAPMPAGARILDAGCGLGAGLAELHRVYPAASLDGLEWSWPLRLACGWRCPFARVRRGDMWREDWSGHDMVYMFQRPESMGPAAEKAVREMRPGSWLVSLEFEAAALQPLAVLRNIAGKPVWVYRMR
jgi:hypothetical protein